MPHKPYIFADSGAGAEAAGAVRVIAAVALGLGRGGAWGPERGGGVLHAGSHIYIYIYPGIHTYMHTYIRTYIHTYIHTHSHTIVILGFLALFYHTCMACADVARSAHIWLQQLHVFRDVLWDISILMSIYIERERTRHTCIYKYIRVRIAIIIYIYIYIYSYMAHPKSYTIAYDIMRFGIDWNSRLHV